VYIYTITNVRNGKMYVGQTRRANADVRWVEHRVALSNNRYSRQNPHLQAAWDLYGGGAFEFEVIDVARRVSDLDEREAYYIRLFNSLDPDNGYNQRHGGTAGYFATEETRARMSKAGRGKAKSLEHRARISASRVGRPHPHRPSRQSEESRALLSQLASLRVGEKNAFFGKRHSEATRRQWSRVRTGKIRSPESRARQSETMRQKHRDGDRSRTETAAA